MDLGTLRVAFAALGVSSHRLRIDLDAVEMDLGALDRNLDRRGMGVSWSRPWMDLDGQGVGLGSLGVDPGAL